MVETSIVLGERFLSFMSSIIRLRSGVMTRSFAQVNGVETTCTAARRKRAVSIVKRKIGDEGERQEKPGRDQTKGKRWSCEKAEDSGISRAAV